MESRIVFVMFAGVLSSVKWLETEGSAIARGLRKRDPKVLDSLIEQYQHRLLRYLVYLTGNMELSEDLFQETWIRVLERGAQYNGKSRFDTWLFAIARHLVIDTSRKKTTLSLEAMTHPEEGFTPVEFASAEPTPFENLFRREQGTHLTAALKHLEFAQR